MEGIIMPDVACQKCSYKDQCEAGNDETDGAYFSECELDMRTTMFDSGVLDSFGKRCRAAKECLEQAQNLISSQQWNPLPRLWLYSAVSSLGYSPRP
jgi:hypothetical protein